MPELPDITVYVDALRARVVGRVLAQVSIRSPFVLRTFDPPVEALEGRVVTGVERLGKRIVFVTEGGGPLLVVHLMIAGRFRWLDAQTRDWSPVPPRGKIDLAAFAFENGTLTLSEASQKKRASMHVVASREDLRALAPVGLDVQACTPADFAAMLTRENRTLKRRLTDPRAFDGIGNAYSDEILHAARLSPIALTSRLKPEEILRLHVAARETLDVWTRRLREELGHDPVTGSPCTPSQAGRLCHPTSSPGPSARFPGPGEITAFRPDFAVHGRFGKPCPVCGYKVARIVRAENEVNYCPTCQTGGRVLADRSLSRLLKGDWPDTVEEWEAT